MDHVTHRLTETALHNINGGLCDLLGDPGHPGRWSRKGRERRREVVMEGAIKIAKIDVTKQVSRETPPCSRAKFAQTCDSEGFRK